MTFLIGLPVEILKNSPIKILARGTYYKPFMTVINEAYCKLVRLSLPATSAQV